MIPVDIVFLFFAAIAFIGFIIDALFYKLKISSILPLMIIGLVVGPVLNLVNATSGSTASQMLPYVSALAVAFVLFDVGINMKVHELSSVIKRATLFTFMVGITSGIVAALIAYYTFGWPLIEAFIFGFAVSGPSSITVPTLIRVIRMKSALKTSMLYESVISDSFQLVVPIILIGILVSPITSVADVIGFAVIDVLGAILLAAILAVFWLYLLNRYMLLGKAFSWMLTITMVLATYGLAEVLGVSSAITVFVFGLVFANFHNTHGIFTKRALRHFAIGDMLIHIRGYQKEITFFISAFFFVYMGILFSFNELSTIMVAIAVIVSVAFVAIRYIFMPVLKPYFSDNKTLRTIDRRTVFSNISRGLAAAIVATIPLSLGIVIPYYLDTIFLIMVFSTVGSTIGVMFAYRNVKIRPIQAHHPASANQETKG